jgi:hypothetical protein
MTIIERAFDLARSGTCRSVQELETQLKREGFASVAAHLSGSLIRRQLRKCFDEARRAEVAART